jgi:hypothetical protein
MDRPREALAQACAFTVAVTVAFGYGRGYGRGYGSRLRFRLWLRFAVRVTVCVYGCGPRSRLTGVYLECPAGAHGQHRRAARAPPVARTDEVAHAYGGGHGDAQREGQEVEAWASNITQKS